MKTFDQQFDFLIREFGEDILLNGQPTKAIFIEKFVSTPQKYYNDNLIYTREELKNGDLIFYQNFYWYVINLPTYKENCSYALIRQATNILNVFSESIHNQHQNGLTLYPEAVSIPSIVSVGTIDANQNGLTGKLEAYFQRQATTIALRSGEPLVFGIHSWKIITVADSMPGILKLFAIIDTDNNQYDNYVDEIPGIYKEYHLQNAPVDLGGLKGKAENFPEENIEIAIINKTNQIKLGTSIDLEFQCLINGEDYSRYNGYTWTQYANVSIIDGSYSGTLTNSIKYVNGFQGSTSFLSSKLFGKNIGPITVELKYKDRTATKTFNVVNELTQYDFIIDGPTQFIPGNDLNYNYNIYVNGNEYDENDNSWKQDVMISFSPSNAGTGEILENNGDYYYKISSNPDFDEENFTISFSYTLSNGTSLIRNYTVTNENYKEPEPPTPVETYTISFNSNGGSGDMPSIKAQKGSYTILPSSTFTPPSEKEFKAWKIGEAEYSAGASYLFTEDTTVYAVWRDSTIINPPTTYTITFDGNGGSGSMESIIIEENSSYTLPNNGFNPPENKVFKAWRINNVEYQPGETYTVNSNITIYAVWKDDNTGPVTYTITFNSNGGSGSMDTISVNAGTVYTLPVNAFTAPSDKVFKAWSINGVEYETGYPYTVNSDIIVYAVWKDNVIIIPPQDNYELVICGRNLIQNNGEDTVDEPNSIFYPGQSNFYTYYLTKNNYPVDPDSDNIFTGDINSSSFQYWLGEGTMGWTSRVLCSANPSNSSTVTTITKDNGIYFGKEIAVKDTYEDDIIELTFSYEDSTKGINVSTPFKIYSYKYDKGEHVTDRLTLKQTYGTKANEGKYGSGIMKFQYSFLDEEGNPIAPSISWGNNVNFRAKYEEVGLYEGNNDAQFFNRHAVEGTNNTVWEIEYHSIWGASKGPDEIYASYSVGEKVYVATIKGYATFTRDIYELHVENPDSIKLGETLDFDISMNVQHYMDGPWIETEPYDGWVKNITILTDYGKITRTDNNTSKGQTVTFSTDGITNTPTTATINFSFVYGTNDDGSNKVYNAVKQIIVLNNEGGTNNYTVSLALKSQSATVVRFKIGLLDNNNQFIPHSEWDSVKLESNSYNLSKRKYYYEADTNFVEVTFNKPYKNFNAQLTATVVYQGNSYIAKMIYRNNI